MKALTKLSVVFVAVLFMLDIVPIIAFADGDYNLWVGGVQVTPANANDVLGDGTVAYNPGTNTLTLTNANIASNGNSGDEESKRIGILSRLSSLTIEGSGTIIGSEEGITQLENQGTLTINGTGAGLNITGLYYGIRKGPSGELVLSGKISAVSTGTTSTGIYARNAITINEGADITVESQATQYNDTNGLQCGIVSLYGPVTIEGGNVNTTGCWAGIGTMINGTNQTGAIAIEGGTVNAQGLMCGIYSQYSIDISDATITAVSTTPKSSGSFAGIRTSRGGISITGNSTVSASTKNYHAIQAYNGELNISDNLQVITPVDGVIARGLVWEAGESAIASTAIIGPAPCTVTYKVVNGTWSDGTAEDRTEAVISGMFPADIPVGMIANEGFLYGAWDEDPSSEAIIADTTFIYLFIDDPFINPDFIMPENLAVIDESAFEGVTKLMIVDAGNCSSIDKGAFKNTGLMWIRLPADCDIDDDAFDSDEMIFVVAPAGGTTQTWCNDPVHEYITFIEED